MDTIANLLTSIRNAEMAGHASVTVPSFKVGEAIVAILKANRYITSFSKDEKTITISLVTPRKLHTFKRVSKPGRRMYVDAKNIPTILGGKGMTILTTSEGIMSGKEAKKRKIGGELLCEVY